MLSLYYSQHPLLLQVAYPPAYIFFRGSQFLLSTGWDPVMCRNAQKEAELGTCLKIKIALINVNSGNLYDKKIAK